MKPLPCPFCGSNPEVRPFNPKTEGDAWGRVVCVNINCQANPGVGDGVDVADDRGSDEYKRAAIERWNGRREME